MVKNTEIKAAFNAYENTAWFERYMLNAYQFSSAKDLSETQLLQKLVFETKSFKEFKEKASEIININRDQWLRVEINVCKRSCILGEKWRSMERDKDLYPYWVYETRMDNRVRPEHAALEGKVFRIGDPYGDSVHPQNSWNCRCTTRTVDSRYLNENNKTLSKGEDYLNKIDPETGKPYIDKDFRFNPGKQTLPNNSSYSEVLSSANKLKSKDFGL